MRRLLIVLVVAALLWPAWAQGPWKCSCGSNPPGPPAPRSLKPYTGAPEDLRPFSKFTTPYYEYYQDLIEYNGAAREIPDPDPKDVGEVRIGFLAPLYDHPDQLLGSRMLNGAQMAIDEANAGGGYGGKPFRLIRHNDYDNWQSARTADDGVSKDSAIWGAASNDAVRMIYDDKVWAMFGSISSESTHIALRLTLKAETPLVNSASTDPTIPETIIPWYFTDIQDDRLQCYTLARHIYTELGLKRVAILRVNDRYGRLGVVKFKDASRRLGHPVVIEQKFLKGDTDFRRQLQVIEDSRVDAILLWTDIEKVAGILQQMQKLGMKQRVFGSHRTLGPELIKLAGTAAEGFEALYPYDPSRSDPRWLDFQARYEARFHEKPDHFAALAYDQMQILLDAICRAGLNRGRIRDALTGVTSYSGVTGEMIFDPNCKNIAPLYLGTVQGGTITYRRITMEKPGSSAENTGDSTEKSGAATDKAHSQSGNSTGAQSPNPAKPAETHQRNASEPYARVGEDGVEYFGPALSDSSAEDVRIGVFGPNAEAVVTSLEIANELDAIRKQGVPLSLVPIPSQLTWGKASTELVNAVYHDHVIAILALDRNSSHLAEQIGVKAFVPVMAIASDRALTSTNIPWIFRLPPTTPPAEAIRYISAAVQQAGTNRASVRELLASGASIAGARFNVTGELAK